jgi:hypothetical protein
MEERTLHDRLVEIQSSLKAPKGQYNSFGKYKYRSAEDILEAVKPILRAQNCKLTIMDEIVAVGERIYVKAIATISDGTQSLSVCAFAREEDEKKGMDASQVTGAASSYARKYALNGLFAIDDTKDADALNVTKEYTESKADPVPAKMVMPDCPEDIYWRLVKMDVEGKRSKTGLSGFEYLLNKYHTDETILAKFANDVKTSKEARINQDFLDLDESKQNPKNKDKK